MAREADGSDLTVQLGGNASDQLEILLDDAGDSPKAFGSEGATE